MIGLFFGDTEFPKKILQKIKKNKNKYIIIDLSKKKLFKKNPYSQSFGIGQFSKIFKFLSENKCKKVLFAGKINKPKFSSLKLDFKSFYYLPTIIKAAKLGDAAILKVIINILIKEKIKVISSNFYNPELTLSKGFHTKLKPSINDGSSIKKGITYFNKLNNLDHVQAVIVKDDAILAIEDRQGTKKMLSKLLLKRKFMEQKKCFKS